MYLSSDEKHYFYQHIEPLLELSDIQKMRQYIQHGNTSCLEHCLTVAYYSYLIAQHFHFNLDLASLIRGALLHDFFLYDWHDRNNHISFHGFRHPSIALANAKKHFSLTPIEKDIICHHMWPLTPTPPHTKEAYLVCLVDKWCSLKETFHQTTDLEILVRYASYLVPLSA